MIYGELLDRIILIPLQPSIYKIINKTISKYLVNSYVGVFSCVMFVPSTRPAYAGTRRVRHFTAKLKRNIVLNNLQNVNILVLQTESFILK